MTVCVDNRVGKIQLVEMTVGKTATFHLKVVTLEIIRGCYMKGYAHSSVNSMSP